jgi:hypothetical protein
MHMFSSGPRYHGWRNNSGWMGLFEEYLKKQDLSVEQACIKFNISLSEWERIVSSKNLSSFVKGVRLLELMEYDIKSDQLRDAMQECVDYISYKTHENFIRYLHITLKDLAKEKGLEDLFETISLDLREPEDLRQEKERRRREEIEYANYQIESSRRELARLQEEELSGVKDELLYGRTRESIIESHKESIERAIQILKKRGVPVDEDFLLEDLRIEKGDE